MTVSRSFAVVIQELHPELRDAVRATLPAPSPAPRLALDRREVAHVAASRIAGAACVRGSVDHIPMDTVRHRGSFIRQLVRWLAVGR